MSTEFSKHSVCNCYLRSIYDSNKDSEDLPHGMITQLNLWNRSLTNSEMENITGDCSYEVNKTSKGCHLT